MTINFSALNWLAIASAFVAYSILGALWFTLLFKQQYLLSLGKEDAPQQKPAPIFFIGPAICTLVVTIANALLIYALQINSWGNLLLFSAIVGFVYLFANTVNIGINPNIPRPILYGMISGFFHLAGMLISCSILFALK